MEVEGPGMACVTSNHRANAGPMPRHVKAVCGRAGWGLNNVFVRATIGFTVLYSHTSCDVRCRSFAAWRWRERGCGRRGGGDGTGFGFLPWGGDGTSWRLSRHPGLWETGRGGAGGTSWRLSRLSGAWVRGSGASWGVDKALWFVGEAKGRGRHDVEVVKTHSDVWGG